MPKTQKHSARELGSRTARVKLQIQVHPYFSHIADGLSLGYRKGKRGGTWIARSYDQSSGYRFQPLGTANDMAEDVGMSFDQAGKAAKDWYIQLAKADAGDTHTGPYTVAQAMEDYITDRERVKRKRQTDTRSVINAHIIPTLGKIDVAKLTHGKVKAWRDALADAAPRHRTKAGKPQQHREHDPTDADAVRKRQASVNRVLTILKAALNYAHSETKRVASKDAWESVKPFKRVDVPKVRFLTAEEVTKLIVCCPPTFEVLVKAALLTGCRYGELTALQAQHFDAEQGTIYIAESKNGESRYVALNDEGVALFQQLTAEADPEATIFIKGNGIPWKKSEQKRPIDAACDLAMIEPVTFHILRHTYASHAVMNGMPLAVLAEQLGHKDTRITERHYAHLCKTYKHRLVRANAPTFGFGNGEDRQPSPAATERKTGRILSMADALAS